MSMLSYIDFLGGLLCLIILNRFLVMRIRSFDFETQSLIRKSFYFRVFCAILYSVITAYYYNGGDTEMFLYATRDIYNAVSNGDISIFELIVTQNGLEAPAGLTYHFEMDNEKYPVYGFMRDAGNFMVPKLGIIPYTLFFKSYVAMCFTFTMFALEGCIRLYKLMLIYFPKLRYELALAILFIPSACYWSSGFLKDSICFGSAGMILYGLYNIFIAKRKIVGSIIAVTVAVYFMYNIKVYILLAFVPAIAFWLLGELRNVTRQVALRNVITFVSLILAAYAAFYMVTYLTSDESLSKFSLDNILETSSTSREMYENQSTRSEGSYFKIEASNPVSLALSGLAATFFRPFPWEVSSAIVLLSSIESMFFLSLFLFLIFKKGLIAPFKTILKHPIVLMCFMFAVVFSISVGISATNFGSLSRYKIPCLPFYMMFIVLTYYYLGVGLPKWFYAVLKVIRPRRHS